MSKAQDLVIIDAVPQSSFVQETDNDDCIVGTASVAYTLKFPKVSEEKLQTYADILRRTTNTNVIYLVEDSTLKVFLHVDEFCSFPNTRPGEMSLATAAVHDQTYRRCKSSNEYVKLIYESVQQMIQLENRLKEVLYVD